MKQIRYFKEQVTEWADKAAIFCKSIQIADNFAYASRRFGKNVKGKCITKKSSKKDKTTAELEARNAELELVCELLRGGVFGWWRKKDV